MPASENLKMNHIYGFLNTQPLWKHEQFGLKQFEMPEMDLTSFTPAPIPTNLRLGHQVEYIFKQLLDHTERYHVLAHNIQIKRGNDTIGELDFIVEDRFRESVLKHIELTYKFYIIDPSISEPMHRLMGPNRRDMFFRKMEKTRDKQLPLVYSKEGRARLETLQIDLEVLIQEVCFVGQLFVPYGQTTPSIRPLNPECIVGFWLPFDTFNTATFKNSTYYIPHKYQWTHGPHPAVTWKSHFEILMDINLHHINERAPMVWMQKEDGTLEKFFVVWW